MSSDEVYKFVEVRVFSLVIIAIGIFAICVFLCFFFVLRGQYVYAVAAAALAVVLLFGALELYRYAVNLKRHEKDSSSENKNAHLLLMSLIQPRDNALRDYDA